MISCCDDPNCEYHNEKHDKWYLEDGTLMKDYTILVSVCKNCGHVERDV